MVNSRYNILSNLKDKTYDLLIHLLELQKCLQAVLMI